MFKRRYPRLARVVLKVEYRVNLATDGRGKECEGGSFFSFVCVSGAREPYAGFRCGLYTADVTGTSKRS